MTGHGPPDGRRPATTGGAAGRESGRVDLADSVAPSDESWEPPETLAADATDNPFLDQMITWVRDIPGVSLTEREPRAAYATSPVKRRRRTVAELDAVDRAIITAVSTENPVTVRGVYYRVVSAGAVEKTERGYDLVGRQLLKLRRDGRVPYSWITDGTRLILKPNSWTRLDEMLDDAAASYRRALWHDQDSEVIVLSEKDAISGVIYPVTARYDVELGIARGYSSETFTHSIAETINDNDRVGKTTFVYQLGDHDPSGVDAWRSFQERVRGFVPHADVEFERLAVNPEQIALYGLPTRPTKTTDSRAKRFVGGSVEVDAIPPTELRSIVEAAIVEHIDPDQLRLTRIAEDSERDILHRMAGAE
jgi:hypothetical protein